LGKKLYFRRNSINLIKRIFNLLNLPRIGVQVPISNGFFESTGCDLIHFPYQMFTICALPSVYNPHDLQHLHFPQFFTPKVILWRETIYQAGCHYANTVVVGSQWIKDDLIEKYGLNSKKIQVIPWGAPTLIISNPTDEFKSIVKKKYSLPDSFAFYPAMLWEHKNHLRLLDAIAYLRDTKNLKINLVCSGNINTDFWERINQHLQDLNLLSQVQFLGMVSYEELRALYQLSKFVVIPTLFEAASGPVFEAWFEKTPVACSSVTSLPEQVGDAAFIFNPLSMESIANSLLLLSTEDHLRNGLISKGTKRLQDFNWERTAKAYRAIYRRVGKQNLTDEDKMFLNWDWMKYPNKIKQEKL
jgi:glycosyltransferase involved in cell wall biosynthesis